MPEQGPKQSKKLTRRERTALSQAEPKPLALAEEVTRRDFLWLGALSTMLAVGGIGAVIGFNRYQQTAQQAELTPDLSRYTPEERSLLAEIYTKPSVPRLRDEVQALTPSVFKDFVEMYGLSSLKDTDHRTVLDDISIPVKAAKLELVTNDTTSGGGGIYFFRKDFAGLSSFKLDKPVPITIPIPHIQYTLSGRTANLELSSAVKAGETYYTGISPSITSDVPKQSTIAREKISYVKKFKDFYEVKEVFSHAFTMKTAEDMVSAFKARGQRPTVTSALGETEMISTFVFQLFNGVGRFKFINDFGSFVLAVKAFTDNPDIIQTLKEAMGDDSNANKLIETILASDLGTDVQALLPRVITWVQQNVELKLLPGSFNGIYTQTP